MGIGSREVLTGDRKKLDRRLNPVTSGTINLSAKGFQAQLCNATKRTYSACVALCFAQTGRPKNEAVRMPGRPRAPLDLPRRQRSRAPLFGSARSPRAMTMEIRPETPGLAFGLAAENDVPRGLSARHVYILPLNIARRHLNKGERGTPRTLHSSGMPAFRSPSTSRSE